MDHPDSIPKSGRFSLIVDPLDGMIRLTKALIVGGSGLNLLYLDTFEGLGLTRDQLQSRTHPFNGVVPGKQSVPLGRVTLPVTFRDVSNYRTETLVIEVANFSRPYHIILGRPCYIKFMAIPSYSYLKLKMPGPAGVITVEAKKQWVLDYKQDSIEPVVVAVVATKLRELKLWILAALPSLDVPMTTSVFKMDEDAKAIQIDVREPTKTV
jgi:hypothetical protein